MRTTKYNLINFRQIRQCLPIDIAKTCMHATIFSHRSYCLTCWGQAGETVIKPVKSLYKQTLKTLDKKPKQQHHCRVLEKYKCLSFDNFIFFIRDLVHFHSTVLVRSTTSSSSISDCCSFSSFWVIVFLNESYYSIAWLQSDFVLPLNFSSLLYSVWYSKPAPRLSPAPHQPSNQRTEGGLRAVT